MLDLTIGIVIGTLFILALDLAYNAGEKEGYRRGTRGH